LCAASFLATCQQFNHPVIPFGEDPKGNVAGSTHLLDDD